MLASHEPTMPKVRRGCTGSLRSAILRNCNGQDGLRINDRVDVPACRRRLDGVEASEPAPQSTANSSGSPIVRLVVGLSLKPGNSIERTIPAHLELLQDIRLSATLGLLRADILSARRR